MTDIRPARFPEDLDAVVRIFREYVASPTVSLDFQDFETEFAALRQVDAQTGEMKRVYVRPTVRGENLGRRLVEGILDAARHAGYTRICLDVLPEFQAAQRLYENLGFVDAEPVSFNPVPGTRYLGLDL